MFFNVLPMRTRIARDASFLNLLSSVRETTLNAYAHQEVPFSRLAQELALPRTLSYAPVFQVLFECELHTGSTASNTHWSALDVQPISVDGINDTAKYDLTMSLVDGRDGVSGTVEFSTDLFDRATVDRFVTHYVRILENVVADPSQRALELTLLLPAEKRQILETWNATDVSWPPASLSELFEQQAAATPSAIAIEDAVGARWNYDAANARANQLARVLQQHGVGAECRVGVCLPRTADLVLGMVAIMKAGGAYVPLDPSYPVERLRYMLQDARAAAVLTDSAHAARLGGDTGVVTIAIDEQQAAIAAASDANLPVSPLPAQLAYVYFTSGSTGRPKGVAIPHEGIVNYVRWGCDAYRADGGSGAPVHSSIAVDLTLTNFLPLFVGRPVVLTKEGSGVDGLLAAIRRRPHWSLLKLTPTHLTLLNPLLTSEEMAASAGVLVIGADQLVGEPTAPWRDCAPDVTLINEYGPTETVVGCCVHTITPDTRRSGIVPIGKPIANITMYVLDAAMQLTPIGVAGELYIGGVGVGRGYWDRTALTAERFLPDPFSRRPGARLYRTGDRARFLVSGDLECLGRFDDQVKLRGYRVELGEIEETLAAHSSVRKAVAMVREDQPGERRLVAYAAVDDDDDVSGGELRAFLKTRVPEHMLPATVVLLQALPVGANGKIDRRALPPPEADRSVLITRYAAPEDSAEKQLIGVLEQLLDVHPIGVEDDFYELGGHSLLAVRLLARVRERFGVELPLKTLVTGATVRSIAAELRERVGAKVDSVIVPIQPCGSRPPLYCVHPAGGDVLCYVALARHLGVDQPVFGVRDPLWSPGGDYSPLSIVEAATQYVAAIRLHRPAGPYYLAGWSFGGTVAFEMAQQLRRAGQEVPMLIQFDTPASPVSRMLHPNSKDDCIVLAALARERAVWCSVECSITAEELMPLSPDGRLRRVVDALAVAGVQGPHVLPAAIEAQLHRWWARVIALQAYEPQVYSGPMLLFRASDVDAQTERDWPELMAWIRRDRTLGWSDFVSTPIEVCDVPGQHVTIASEPHVRTLAAQLTARLVATMAAPTGAA